MNRTGIIAIGLVLGVGMLAAVVEHGAKPGTPSPQVQQPPVNDQPELTTGTQVLQKLKEQGDLGNWQSFVHDKVVKDPDVTSIVVRTSGALKWKKLNATDHAINDAARMLLAAELASVDLSKENLDRAESAQVTPETRQSEQTLSDPKSTTLTLKSEPNQAIAVSVDDPLPFSDGFKWLQDRVVRVEPTVMQIADPPTNCRREPITRMVDNVIQVYRAKGMEVRLTAAIDVDGYRWYWVTSDRCWIHESQLR